MDYADAIDDEVRAFIDKGNEFYPEDAVTRSVAQQRGFYNEMCRAFHRGHPAGVRARDLTFGGVPCREYVSSASDVTVIYYHGGGFVVGDLESHDDVCAEICDFSGFRVVSVDYRLAPEHVHPAAFNDSWAAFAAIAQKYSGPLVLAGDSAGANLGAAVAHHARGRIDQRVVGQVLIYGAFGGDMTQGSYKTHAFAPLLTLEDVIYYMDIRSDGKDSADDYTFAPLRDTDFTGLPATVLFSADIDPLRDDSRDYRDAVLGAGGQATWINEAGLLHGYLRARVMSSRAAASFSRITAAISALGRGTWPY